MSVNPSDAYRVNASGPKAMLPFAEEEYDDRLDGLRDAMDLHGLDAVVLTSTPTVAYYAGFLFCSFGRPYACVVTSTDCVTISAGLDAGQPWPRSFGGAITYTDRGRDAMWKAVASVTGTGKAVGCEASDLTLDRAEAFNTFLRPSRGMDIGPATIHQRMTKSAAEIALITQGAQVTDLGGVEVVTAIAAGATELEVSIAGRDAMAREIVRRFPDAEYQAARVTFRSGPNTDSAHNQLTHRKLRKGDILSVTCLAKISGYCTALTRTLFLGEVDDASQHVWQTNVDTRTFGTTLLRPGVSCADITRQIDAFRAERQMQRYQSFGSDHFVGTVAQSSGSEDSDTMLEPGMVVSLKPTLTIPQGQPGAGGYCEHDIFVVTDDTPVQLSQFPCGPEFNVIA